MTATKRAPGRPKSQSKRQQIFTAAIRLFVSQGYEGTSVEQIADVAGVSKQTVYSHFRDKDELYTEALGHVCERLGMPEGLGEDRRDPERVLGEIGFAFLKLLLTEESRNLYRLVVGSAETHPAIARMFYDTGPRTFMNRLAAYLRQKTAEGLLGIDDPDMAAAQFFAMMRGELHMRAVLGLLKRPGESQLRAYATACAGLFVRGYTGRRHDHLASG